eukprot:3130900-Pyramimonas_sp.AAC.1
MPPLRRLPSRAPTPQAYPESSPTDRTDWIHATLVGGNGDAVKQPRKKPQIKRAEVRDLNNNLTDTAGRPDALADYFEKILWE